MRLHERTTALRAAGRKALVPYLSAGYPDRAAFRRLLRATADAGCDVVEVGVPFSDPVADGPVIQAAGHAALAGGATLRTALDDAGEHAAATGASVVLMTYLNPVLRLGLDVFVDAAADAGLAGVILPDVPREESAQARAALRGRGLDLVDLAAPTSGDDRLRAIAADARGFLYLVSLTGVTGSVLDTSGGVLDFVRGVQSLTDTPCYVGFGVAEPAQAAALGRVADGAIVGSALLRRIGQAGGADAAVDAARRYLTEMNAALNGGQEDVR
ncbi:MAG TPA: tryptophan synthase subunit alpha [Candidatus Krumholzibacteria bacterium]|nr:tryptophan synthase subunit alpha [Candidatus Krumholzibacteria bacterium]HRX52411.1 tryptophan synthase subunit alpha [Candidatus Krumholzibacteria bacterium]